MANKLSLNCIYCIIKYYSGNCRDPWEGNIFLRFPRKSLHRATWFCLYTTPHGSVSTSRHIYPFFPHATWACLYSTPHGPVSTSRHIYPFLPQTTMVSFSALSSQSSCGAGVSDSIICPPCVTINLGKNTALHRHYCSLAK